MKLALECPTYLLKDIQPLADFDWILTHLVLQDKEYTRFYKESANFKVLDNSVNELLEPCSLEDMEEAAVLVDPDLAVPPDWLGNQSATKKSLSEAITVFGKKGLLPCIQGNTLEEVLEYAKYILDLGFNRIAVPYDITCKRTVSREVMASRRLEVVNKIITMVPIGFDIHLLGMTTIEELVRHNKGWIKSIDTGVPIVYGMNCKHLDELWDFKKDKPTISQMEDFREFIDTSIRSNPNPSDKLSAIFWNIAYLRKVIIGT